MKWILSFCFVFMVLACQNESNETNTKGKLHILIPQSISPIIVSEVQAFSALYKESGAEVTYNIATAQNVIQRFKKDTLRLCFSPIPLTKEEKEQVHQISPDLVDLTFAFDAIVAIVPQKSEIIQLTTTEIKNILEGKVSNWSQLSHQNKIRRDLHIILQDSSDVGRYLMNRLSVQKLNPVHWLRSQSDTETLQLVSKDRLALGFISLEWCDSKNAGIRTLELCSTEPETDTLYRVPPEAEGKYFSPHPAYIYKKYYPFYRTLFAYCRNPYSNVAAGLTTFVASSEGQKIILQKGLVPGTQKIVLKPSY